MTIQVSNHKQTGFLRISPGSRVFGRLKEEKFVPWDGSNVIKTDLFPNLEFQNGTGSRLWRPNPRDSISITKEICHLQNRYETVISSALVSRMLLQDELEVSHKCSTCPRGYPRVELCCADVLS